MLDRLSIVIPFYNEEMVAGQVLTEVRQALPGAEIIAVDDGSSDQTWTIITKSPGIDGIRLSENRGQSAAMYRGVMSTTKPFCAFMDGDGQNDPTDIPRMLSLLISEKADVICGIRTKRKDTWSRRSASKIANSIRRVFLQDGVQDTGCSLKIFRAETRSALVPFNGMHRYLPALFLSAGYTIIETPVHHRPRAGGISKYTNWERAIRGLHDLIGVSWLLRRRILFPHTETHHG